MTLRIVPVTLTTDTLIFASGDVLADTQIVDNAVLTVNGTGFIRSLSAIDADDQGVAMYFLFYDANVVTGVENSAPSISDANALNFLGRVTLATTDWTDLGGVRVAQLNSLNIPIRAVAGTTAIYVAAVNGTGTPTFTATGLTLRLGIE